MKFKLVVCFLYNVPFLLCCITGGPSCPLVRAFGDFFFLMNKWPSWAFPVALWLSQCTWTKIWFVRWWSCHGQVIFSSCFMLLQPKSNLSSFVRASAEDNWLSDEGRLLVWCWQSVWGKSDFIPALFLCSCLSWSAVHYWGLDLGFVFIFLRKTQG